MTVDDRPKATTLHELLLELKRGYLLHKPILIEMDAAARPSPEATIDRTMTLRHPLDWVEEYGRELADNAFILLGPNTLASARSPAGTSGRAATASAIAANRRMRS